MTGDASTIREACDRAGLDAAGYAAACRVAREQEWATERAAHERRVQDQARGQVADEEAQMLASARRFGAAATVTALSRVLDRLRGYEVRDGERVPLERYEPRPADCESLARTWALLGDHGDPATDQELDRLRALPLAEQVRETVRTLGAQFGAELVRDLLPGAPKGLCGGISAPAP